MSEQESNEPTLADVMSVLTHLSEKFGDVESRLETHECILHEIQPRLSILFGEHDKKLERSSQNGSEDEQAFDEAVNTEKKASRKLNKSVPYNLNDY